MIIEAMARTMQLKVYNHNFTDLLMRNMHQDAGGEDHIDGVFTKIRQIIDTADVNVICMIWNVSTRNFHRVLINVYSVNFSIWDFFANTNQVSATMAGCDSLHH